jgi:hypothetical protein
MKEWSMTTAKDVLKLIKDNEVKIRGFPLHRSAGRAAAPKLRAPHRFDGSGMVGWHSGVTSVMIGIRQIALERLRTER